MQRELRYEGVTYILFLCNGLLTVTAPDARQKIAEFRGGSAESLALILAKELAGEGAKPPRPKPGPDKWPLKIVWPGLDEEK